MKFQIVSSADSTPMVTGCGSNMSWFFTKRMKEIIVIAPETTANCKFEKEANIWVEEGLNCL
jgi:hypothetical protein